MTISTTSNFTVTRNDLITQALSYIGVTDPQNEEMALGVNVLNALVRNLDARGEWIWGISNTESTLTTVANQQAYVTGTDPENIAQNILKLVYISYLQGNDYIPLIIYDKQSSFLTNYKDDSPGQPQACHLERHNLRSQNRLLLYPTPNSAYTVKYSFRRPLFDFPLPTDNPDFPTEWFLPLQKMLSSELAGHFNKTLAERQWLTAESEKAFQEMIAFNAEKPSYTTLRTEYF
jgi:hypothetical protein